MSVVFCTMIDTIRAVHAGKRRVPPEIATGIAEHFADDVLTEREIEVLRSVATGKSNKLIAAELEISEESVEASAEDLRVVGERYRLGVATIVDLLVSQESLTQAQLSVVNARFNYLEALAQIEAIVGRPL